MNLKKLFLTNNDCYKANKKIKIEGIMIHSTGANNPYLKRYVGPNDGLLGNNVNGNHWNMKGLSVCVHGFVGKLEDGSIATYQTLPWDHRGWHCGGTGNNKFIGIEICEDNLSDSDYFDKVYKEIAEVSAMLCKLYKLNPETDILCHSEGYKKGIASNHADVMHWFPRHGKNMDLFRIYVKFLMNTTSFTPYRVRITDGSLNIRKGPGVSNAIVGVIKDRGVYTIVDIVDGWGKLKSGAGWINLSYTSKLE